MHWGEELAAHLKDEFDQEVLEESRLRVQGRVDARTWDAFRLTAILYPDQRGSTPQERELRWYQDPPIPATYLSIQQMAPLRADPRFWVNQEVFGLDSTPRIAGGRAPITFKLLSPAQRPVQVTRDLASFWRGSYADVRKDMRGRYPKHYWPENPLEAEPTRGVRRRT